MAVTVDIRKKSHFRRGAAIIILATILAYLPAIEGGYVWDDDDYLTENETLRSLTGLKEIWFKPGAVPQYYPLVHTSYWIEFRIWGLDPFGYHLVNILLHAVTAVLLWRFLRRLSVPGAWMAAAAFALHPVHVESVAWITERKNVLSGFFFLAAIHLVQRFLDSRTGVGGRGDKFTYAAAFGLYLCALLSKTVTCSLPAVALLLQWWRHKRLTRRDIAALLPFFAAGLAMAAVTVRMETHSVGARGAEFDLSFVERCLIAGRALWFYLAKLVWPADLSFIYRRWDIDTGQWAQFIYPVIFVAGVIALYLCRGRLGRGPLVAALVFAGVLFPALGFVNVYPMRYTFVADHYQYLASAPIIVLAIAGIHNLGRHLPTGAGQGHGAVRVLCVPILVCFFWLTNQRGGVFKNEETLWRDTIRKNPRAAIAHNNLGLLMADAGRIDEAVQHYRKVIRLKPEHYNAHNNLGMAYTELESYAVAAHHFRRALQIRPEDARILNNLGNLYTRAGNYQDAETAYTRALHYGGNAVDTLNNLGNLYAHEGKFDLATEQFEKLLRLDSTNAQAVYNLGNLDRDRQRVLEAMNRYREAIRLQPDFARAHNNLAILLAESGETYRALKRYDMALRYRPDLLDAHFNVAILLTRLNRYKDAIRHYQVILGRLPDRADIHFNLGYLYSKTKQPYVALSHYTKATQIQPNYPEAYNNAGTIWALQGYADSAIVLYKKALHHRPDYANAHKNLADALAKGNRPEDALGHYRVALAIGGDWPEVSARIAWILATHPVAAARRPAEALRRARAAAIDTEYRVPEILDVLAAAFAANARYLEATVIARESLMLADAAGRTDLVAEISHRLQFYLRNQPFVNTAPEFDGG